MQRLPILAATAMVLALASPPAFADGAWDDIRWSLYGDDAIAEDGLVTLEAPYRAEDAALVPMTIRADLPEGDDRTVTELVLVIDENPAPIAATFTFGPKAKVSEISTRVRVNAYTHVHAVATLSDGSRHVAEQFVKASGGCSAPATKDPEATMATLGNMKFRRFDTPAGADGPMNRVEGQLMIRHPNNSGLQMDQITRLYVPAWFVQNVTVTQGDDLILAMEGGISISEDPSFRFDYLPSGEPIRAEVVDTKGEAFSAQWPSGAS